MNLRWTDAGRAALLDAANVGTAAVKLTHVALGDGQGAGGAADDNRTALRNERDRAKASGASAAGKIALRADFNPDASYGVTEAGVFAAAGGGSPFLALYWTDGGAEAAKAAKGAALAVAATVEFLNSDADVTVEVATDIAFGNVDEATDAAFGTTRYASQSETESGASSARAITPAGLKAAIGKVAAFLLGKNKAAADGTIYQLKGDSGGGLAAEPRTLPDASATQKGIVELATANEAKKGTDAARAVTPAGLKAATDALSVPSAPATATTSRKGIVELASQSETESGSSSARAITPAGLKAAIGKVAAFLLGKNKAAVDGTIYQLKGDSGGGLAAEPRTLPAASATQKGIVELATADEAKKGTDAARAVTPAGLKSATDALPQGLAGKVPAAGNSDKFYVIKRDKSSSGGGLSIVEAVFRRYVTPGTHNFVVPAGVTRLRVLLVGAGGGGGGAQSCGERDYNDDRDPEHGGTIIEFEGCNPGEPGGSGGTSSVRQDSKTLASARGGSGGGITTSSHARRGAPAAANARGYGAGGDGGGEDTSGNTGYVVDAAGGRAGSVAQRTIDVTPGKTLRIEVGRGGSGGAPGKTESTWDTVYLGTSGAAGGGGFVQLVNG